MLLVSLFLGCNENEFFLNTSTELAVTRSSPTCPPLVYESIINCIDTFQGQDLCYEPICDGLINGICPQTNLYACNYTTMEDYAKAVCCALNRTANNCNAVGYQPNCTYIDICIGNLIPPPGYLSLPGYEQTNPFRYCRSSACTPAFYCIDPLTSISIRHHVDLSIAAQNAIIHYAWCVAGNPSIMPEPNCSSGWVPIAVYFKVCEPGFPTNCGFPNCTNYQIKLRVIYECCS